MGRAGAGLAVVLAVLATGCGPRAVLRPTQAVSDAEVLGRAIFEQDRVSAVATDALRAAGALDPERVPRGATGWVTVRTISGWLAAFIARRDGRLRVFAQVRFEEAQPEDGYQLFPGRWYSVVPEPVPGGRQLLPDERAWFQAQETALARHLPFCSPGYNPVVLPAHLAGQDGLLVYLLPPQPTVTSFPLAFQRYLVSGDGTRLLEALQLTRECFTLEARQQDATGFVLSHPLADVPQEHHVWLSLASGRWVGVVVRGGARWVVSEGAVHGPLPAPPAPR